MAQYPQARSSGLLVDDVQQDVVVYDTTSHEAHSLDPVTALVWRHCDGQTGAGQLATVLQRELGQPVDAAVVPSALAQLERANLLEQRLSLPVATAGTSRRGMLQRMGATGATAVLAPLVTTIAVPTAAMAASAGGNTPPSGGGGTGGTGGNGSGGSATITIFQGGSYPLKEIASYSVQLPLGTGTHAVTITSNGSTKSISVLGDQYGLCTIPGTTFAGLAPGPVVVTYSLVFNGRSYQGSFSFQLS